MDAILTDLYLDTKITICILINVIVPTLECNLWEMMTKFVKQLETVQMTAAKELLRLSGTTSNTVLKDEIRMNPLAANRDVRKLKWQ